MKRFLTTASRMPNAVCPSPHHVSIHIAVHRRSSHYQHNCLRIAVMSLQCPTEHIQPTSARAFRQTAAVLSTAIKQRPVLWLTHCVSGSQIGFSGAQEFHKGVSVVPRDEKRKSFIGSLNFVSTN